MAGTLRRILSSRALCAAAIAVFLLLTAAEGTWGIALHRNPAMWAVAVVMMVSLGSAIPDDIRKRRGPAGTLSHTGMFLLLFGTLCGAPCMVDVQMVAPSGSEVREAFSRNGEVEELPFGVRLEAFDVEYYADGVSPKQYTSTLLVDGRRMRTSVNHPCRYKGYRIYQSDYDRKEGAYSVLKLVRDPWLPVVFLGLLLLAAAAVLSLKRYWNSWYALAATAAVALAFGAISLARINFGTLMPALRSLWFIPHIALYMLAYASLALALIAGGVAAFSGRWPGLAPLSEKLSGTASSLLLLGMICGAVWAKAAWGDWWTWDSKECWAAVTWLMTVLGTHLPQRLRKGRGAALACTLLAFIAMQVAWYGVDLLPAAQWSLHTYR